MRIEIIAEASHKYQRFFKNWGLSFLIDNKILFDTFSNSRILQKNLKKNNVDVSAIKYVVISHEHWDHTGGLWGLLEHNKKLTVILNKNFSNNFKNRIKLYGVKVVELGQDFYKITDNIYSTGEIKGLYKEKKISEQSIVINDENDIIVLTGCAHPGILEILKKVKKKFNKNIALLTGGFHLMNNTEFKLKKTILQLKKNYHIEKIAPCHCTGDYAVKIIKKVFSAKYIKIKSSMILEV